MTAGRPDYTSQALMKGIDSGTHRTVAVDNAGNMLTLMKGQYGGAPVTIAVDSTGKLYGLLQGDYEGAVKTLAVDSLGRMLAVLTDPEDVFGNPHYMGAAELAARLGSPAIFDRGGQVLFQDPGGRDAAMYKRSGAGASSAFDAYSGLGGLWGQCYRIIAGPSATNYTDVCKWVPFLVSGGVGFEVTVSVDGLETSLEMNCTVYDGAVESEPGIKYVTADEKLYYRDSAGAWIELGARSFGTNYGWPMALKLRVSPVTGNYMDLRVNEKLYDMSALAMYAGVAVSSARIIPSLRLTCAAGGDTAAHVCGLVVTGKEV